MSWKTEEKKNPSAFHTTPNRISSHPSPFWFFHCISDPSKTPSSDSGGNVIALLWPEQPNYHTGMNERINTFILNMYKIKKQKYNKIPT